MTKYQADIKLTVTVEFEDDEESTLADQAIDSIWETWTLTSDLLRDADFEIMGNVREFKK